MFQVPESIEVVQMTEYPVESSAEVVVDLNEKKTIRVLHVDDEDSLLKVAKQCLEMQGSFQVDTASSADEAIEKMKKEKYDIILSDYQMPGKNGLEFLKELRTNGNRTPFVMFTGKGREEIVIKALNLGADHYVNKNGDPETVYFELTHCLHSAVKKRAVEAKAAETAQRLQTINQNAAEGISYVNPEENFVYVNHAFADILGCKEDQLVGMNMRRFVDEEGWSKIKSETERRRKGKAGRYDLVFHRTDGTTRNVQISGSPLFDSDGGFAGTVSIVLDITDRKKVEQRLREPEDMLASIFDAAADGIAYVDTSGKTIAANRRLVEMLGHTLDDTIGGNFLKHDRIDPKDLPRVSKAMEEAVTTAEPARNFEVTLIRKDGSRIPTEINTGIVKKDGKVAGIIAAVRDVTERKKKEIALRESEEKYKDLFESAMDVILTLDLKGNVTAVNSSILRFGYKKEDLVGKSILDFVSKEHWPTIMRDFSQVIQGEPAKNETEIVVPTGKILVEYHARAILKESNVTGMQINLRDVTERKKVEETVRSSEAKLRAILASSPEAISVSDLNAKLIDCNEAFLKLHGYLSKEELIGTSWFDVVAPVNRSKIQDTIAKLLEHGCIKNMEFVFLKKGSQEFIGELSASLVLDSYGKPTSIVVVARDITERKEMEEKLGESEGRFRSLFESIQDPVGIFVGKEGRLIDYNTAFKKSSGYTDEELRDKAFLDFVHPDDHAMVLEKYQTKYSEEEFPLVYEIRGMNKKGESIPLELSVSTYKKKGRVIGIEVIHRDITERKRYEHRLSALNIHGRNLNTAKSMEEVYELTLDATEKTLGFEFADIFMVKGNMLQLVTHQGKTKISSLSLPMDGDRGITVRAARTGKPVLVPDISKEEAYIEGEEGGRSELVVPIKIGPRVLGVLNVESKELDAFNEKDQELLEILASHAATAISNLDRAKDLEAYAREIRESKQKFEGLFLGNPEATICLAPDFSILDINPRFRELFGHSLSEIKGKHIDEVVVPRDKMNEAEMLNGKAVEGYVYHDTLRIMKDGSLVPVSISAAPIRVEGKLIGYIGVYKDISDLKKTERKLESMNEKLRVVGGLTRHDARNKLSTITGNAYLLKKQLTGNKEALDKLGDMETAVQQTDRIFDFAKTYEMLGAEDLVYVDVEKTVNEAISLFPSLDNIKTANDCHGLTVLADSLLRQLYYNLIDNSLKYGLRTTRIRAYYERTGQDELKLVYEDDGVGIPSAEKSRLFKEGYSTGGSTGYGLYLIKKMMEVYGWKIQENGEPGKGARFVMTIPKTKPNGKENYRIA